MPVFRRNSAGAADGKAQDSRGVPGGHSPGSAQQAEQSPEAPAKTRPAAEAAKGRPTPKRSHAERNRYQTITGSTTSGRGPSTGAPKRGGKATPEDKARARSERVRRMEAMRGPTRKLARDYVDANRRPSEYYMYVLLLLLVALLSRNSALNTYVTPVVFILIVVVVLDAYFIRRALRRLAAERFPGESTRGMTTYAVMRALQIRRFRTPAPRLKPGDKY
jgi:hypothetical protein